MKINSSHKTTIRKILPSTKRKRKLHRDSKKYFLIQGIIQTLKNRGGKDDSRET